VRLPAASRERPLEPVGNDRPRQMIISDRTRLTDFAYLFSYIRKNANKKSIPYFVGYFFYWHSF